MSAPYSAESAVPAGQVGKEQDTPTLGLTPQRGWRLCAELAGTDRAAWGDAMLNACLQTPHEYPTEPREPAVTAEQAKEIMEQAGFKPKGFGGDE